MRAGSVIIFILALGLLSPLFFAVIASHHSADPITSFKKCISDKEVVLACTTYSTPCKEQSRIINGFSSINYKNCDFEKHFCQVHSVTKYPTWVFPDGRRIEGIMNISELSRWTGCQMEE